MPPSSDGKFVIDVYSPDCMFKGTTLFAANDRDKTSHIVEVDYAGRVVWSVTPSDLMYVPRNLQVMDVERLPSGNTLFNIKNYGAFEVTHDRKLVWQVYDNGISHDVDRLPNGDTLYVRGWVAKGQPPEGCMFAVLPTPRVMPGKCRRWSAGFTPKMWIGSGSRVLKFVITGQLPAPVEFAH